MPPLDGYACGSIASARQRAQSGRQSPEPGTLASNVPALAVQHPVLRRSGAALAGPGRGACCVSRYAIQILWSSRSRAPRTTPGCCCHCPTCGLNTARKLVQFFPAAAGEEPSSSAHEASRHSCHVDARRRMLNCCRCLTGSQRSRASLSLVEASDVAAVEGVAGGGSCQRAAASCTRRMKA